VERKTISKKKRFEIFKRDGFTCQYCGKKPPDVVLEIDHINPIKNGGDNDDMNLITSCYECNRGKGCIALENIPNKPDADIEYLQLQQEIVELKKYQEIKKKKDELLNEVVEDLQILWAELWLDEYIPSRKELISWLSWASPENIDKAMTIAASKLNNTERFETRLRYTAGVLHNLEGTRRNG